VNNLPRVVTQPRPAVDRTRDLLIASPTPYHCATTRHPIPSDAKRERVKGEESRVPNTERRRGVGVGVGWGRCAVVFVIDAFCGETKTRAPVW